MIIIPCRNWLSNNIQIFLVYVTYGFLGNPNATWTFRILTDGKVFSSGGWSLMGGNWGGSGQESPIPAPLGVMMCGSGSSAVALNIFVAIEVEVQSDQHAFGLCILYEGEVTEFILVWCLDTESSLWSHLPDGVADIDGADVLQTTHADIQRAERPWREERH